MKRNVSILLISILFCFSFLNLKCSSEKSKDSELTTLAKKFIYHLIKEEHEKSQLMFDETMKRVYPLEKQKSDYEMIISLFGEFESLLKTRIERVQGYDIVYVTCKFKNTKLDFKVVFDKEKKVAGLFTLPSQS